MEANPEASFVVRTEEEDKTFFDNYKESELKKMVRQQTAEAYNRLDSVILEVTGIGKAGETEKTSDYAKRILKSFSEELSELKNKKPAPVTDERIKELEGVIQKITKEKDDAIATERNEKLSFKTRTEVEKALWKLPLDPSIPDIARNAVVEVTINGLLRDAEWREDGLVFKDEKGEVLRNKQTYKPLTPDELLADKLGDILKKDRKLPGKDIPGGDPKPADLPGTLPPHVTTKVLLSEYLGKTLGLKPTSKEYKELYALGKDLPLQ